MKILKNCGGQVSIEFIILVGAIMIMVVAVFPYITRANELSKAHAAARDGATFAAGMRGMGYRADDVNELPPGIVKITKVEMVNVGSKGNRTHYQFNIHILAPEYMIDDPTCTKSSVGVSVIRQALKYVCYSFYGDWSRDECTPFNVNTTRYYFTATCTFE
jgi:hypothetical protein